MFCAVCRTASGTALPLYHKLRDKNLHAKEDQIFSTFAAKNGLEQCRLNLVEVQRVTLHTLQLHIANLVGIIHKSGCGGGGCEDWRELAEYLVKSIRGHQAYLIFLRTSLLTHGRSIPCSSTGTALQDLEYLRTLAKGPDNGESACITSSWQIGRDVLEHAGLVQNHMNPAGPALPPPVDARQPQLGWRAPPQTTQQPPPVAPPVVVAPSRTVAAQRTKPTSQLQRFSVAIGGALSLLIPTFIMVLVRGKP